MEQKNFHKYIGGNFRLDEIQASVLNIKLKQLDLWNEKRIKNAEAYINQLSNLEEKGFVSLPRSEEKNEHVFNQFTLVCKNRDKLREFLLRKGIKTEVYYPIPLHLQECFKMLRYKKGDFPVAETVCENVLSIPIYPELTKERRDYVIDNIKEFYIGHNFR